MDSRIEAIELRLLKGKTWRYLRYVHMREYLASVASEIATVCVCGTGHGLAETALAIEYPQIKFTFTDIIAQGYPNYHGAMQLCWQWDIRNIEFSVWNVMEAAPRKFDFVCSTEMLEHIDNPVRAAHNMRNAALSYVYCLVPFSDWETNNNKRKRERAYQRNEHKYYGFDRTLLEGMFGLAEQIAGTYWSDAGLVLRNRLSDLTDGEITKQFQELKALAHLDLRDNVPKSLLEAGGIKILTRATARGGAINMPPSLRNLGIL